MNTAVEPAALLGGGYLPPDPVSFCQAPMNSNPHVNGIYFNAYRVKVWSGRKSKDSAG